MASTKREAVYDEEIAPLMSKIIGICKEHEIPIVFSAQLNDNREDPQADTNEETGEELGPLFCTTVLAGGPRFPHAHEKLMRAAAALRPQPASFAAYTISDGVAQRVTGSEDGYDPGVPGAVRGRVLP
jgi:hypothetical protein